MAATRQAVVDMAGNAVDEASVDALRTDLRGPLLRQGAEGYDAARAIWNGMIDKRPGLIARCTGVADVMASVRFAREHDLLVAIKGGGHSVAGTALCDDGLVIDLSGMRGVHVDPVGRTARVQPGATLGDVDHETQAFGLAVPAGIVTTTGVAGLTLGGGFGWLSPKLGLTCDNLISADVVTADGELVTASEDENTDLFWGIRGGGGNFGVVTSFNYNVHPVGPDRAGRGGGTPHGGRGAAPQVPPRLGGRCAARAVYDLRAAMGATGPVPAAGATR